MQHPSLGADLRSLRKLRGMTLEDMAVRLGKSVGWISQVERDISTPRVSDLRDIARIYDVPLSLFFGKATGPENEMGRVVRSRVVNPKWIEGVKRHGYKGAFELAATID